MTFVRRLFAAVLAASLVWAGSAGTVQAHSHETDDHHSGAIHAMAEQASADHAAADMHEHDHGASHDGAAGDSQDGLPKHDHEKGVVHVHAISFVALTSDYVALPVVLLPQSSAPPIFSEALYTRSVMPADRPPRLFL